MLRQEVSVVTSALFVRTLPLSSKEILMAESAYREPEA
jgi:hypothetical protein